MKKLTVIFIMLLMTAPVVAFAETPEVETAGDYMGAVGTKLGRGLENIVTSPAEIPCTMSKEMHKGNPAAGFFTGFAKGTGLFVWRAFVGVTEVASFMIPMERTIPRVCTDQVSASEPSSQPA